MTNENKFGLAKALSHSIVVIAQAVGRCYTEHRDCCFGRKRCRFADQGQPRRHFTAVSMCSNSSLSLKGLRK